jgi:hypothetical protein
MEEFWNNFCFVLGLAVVAAFILVGGYMIGSAVAFSNQVEHDRQFECIDRGGHMEYVTNLGEVCRK